MVLQTKELKKLSGEVNRILELLESRPLEPISHMVTYRGMKFEFSLNLQKSGARYPYRGTVRALDHAAETLRLEGRAASRSICVPHPAGGAGLAATAAERVCKEIVWLFQECRSVLTGQNPGVLNPWDMSLAELILAYGKGFSAKNPRKLKKNEATLSRVEKLAFELGEIPIRRISKKTLNAALPQEAEAETKLKYVRSLDEFLKYVQVRVHLAQELLPFLKEMEEVLAKGKKETCTRRRIKAAANAGHLPSDIEGDLNQVLAGHLLENPRFLAVALIKGGGLDIKDIVERRMEDVQLDEKDPRKVFVSLRREYANSATQIYTFPLFPYEACLVSRYIQTLRERNPERVEPERYLLSDDPDGMAKLPEKGFHAFVRDLLMRYTMGYASRLGDVDLSQRHGVELLKATFRHRLVDYCDVSEQTDRDAFTFLRHQSLAGHTQGDHYRGFRDSDGRERLFGYMLRDQRFLPREKGTKRVLRRRSGKEELLTFRNWEHEENRRIVLTFTAVEDGIARFRAPYGALFQVEKLDGEENAAEGDCVPTDGQ